MRNFASSHLASLLIERVALVHCAVLALACAGCLGGWKKGQPLENLTEAPIRYPTAVARQTPQLAPEIANKPLLPSPSDQATQPKPAPTPPPQWPIHSNKPTAPVAPRQTTTPAELNPTTQPQPAAIAPPDDLASQFAEKSLTTMLATGSPAIGTAGENFPAPQQPAAATAIPAATPLPAQTDVALVAHVSPANAPNAPNAPANATPPSKPAEPTPAKPAAEQPAPADKTAARENTEPSPSDDVAPAADASKGEADAAPNEEETARSLEDQREELITALEAEARRLRDAKAEPAEIARVELQLRLLYLVDEREENAVAAIESLSPPERESLKHLLFGLSTFMSEDDPRRATHRNAKVLRSLRDATHELSAGSRLDLKHLTFCEKVEYFGWYTEFSRAEFQPKQQVILYVEVENFSAEEKGPHSYETELQGSYQIFDASGAIVAERKLPLDREVCRNYRRDYFLAYRLYMPDNIPPGGYRLELTIEDLKARGQYQGRKLGQASIEFAIR